MQNTLYPILAVALAPIASAQLFVTTLDAIEITSESAVLQMTVSGPVDTMFIGQVFQWGVLPDALVNTHRGYDFGVSFVYSEEAGTTIPVESYHIYDEDAMFTIDTATTGYNHQTQLTYSLDTSLKLTLMGLDAETTYFFRAQATDMSEGGDYYGSTLAFTTLSANGGGGSLSTVPEISSTSFLFGLGAILVAVRRRRR